MDFHSDIFFQLVHLLYQAVFYLPGIEYVITYLKNSYQHDPFRIFLEGVLILFTIKYLRNKREDKSKINLTKTVIST